MSFISVEPQSRALSESHSESLLSQFDTQLKIVAGRYLAFFQERRRIEATYIDSLRKLHRKANTVDASFDRRAEPTTTRAAWDTVRDSLERDANTQQAFVNILDHDVIKPLTKLKASEDETRKRIQEALKASTAESANYAENTISKFQRAYLKKYYPWEHSTSAPQGASDKWFGYGIQVPALLRGLREPVKPEEDKEVSDDDLRMAVSELNTYRSTRAEDLGDGYECLQELVFTPIVQEVLVKFMDGMTTACASLDNLAKSTKAEVKKALAGTDTSDLRASFRRALSFAIPPPTFYCNRPGAQSDLIFGVPIVDVTTDRDNVPKVMRMCIEEVEKRGLNMAKIYSYGAIYDAEVLQLRSRLESEKSFSFSTTDNIHCVAILLRRYLWDLPEPLLVLSLQDCRSYRQNRARNAKNDLLQSKIRELHPVQRASLGALCRHLLRVASHSNKNTMTVEALAARFRYAVFRGNEVLQDDVHVKGLILEDLIHNAHTLFDDRTFSVPTPDVKTSTHTFGSLLLSPELNVPAMGSTTRHGLGLVGGIPESFQSHFSSLSSDDTIETYPTLSPIPLLNPPLGHLSSKASTVGVESTTQERVTSEGRGTKTVEGLTDRTLAEVFSVSNPSTTVSEWLSRQSRLPPLPEVPTSPSVPESVLSSISDFPDSATAN